MRRREVVEVWRNWRGRTYLELEEDEDGTGATKACAARAPASSRRSGGTKGRMSVWRTWFDLWVGRDGG